MFGLCCFGGGRFGTVGLPIWQLILCAVPTKGVRRRTVPSAFRWFMCMWPGLSVAWYSGSFRGLAVALLFVLGLQTAWVATFIWPALLTAWESSLLWWSLAFSILGSVVYQTWTVAWQSDRGSNGCPDEALRQSQAMYLQGSYFEAEELLSPHVSNGEWDVEAALWLATIYRRTGRYEAAWAMLQTLESFERSSAWGSEISLEYRKIKESRRNKRVESL